MVRSCRDGVTVRITGEDHWKILSSIILKFLSPYPSPLPEYTSCSALQYYECLDSLVVKNGAFEINGQNFWPKKNKKNN